MFIPLEMLAVEAGEVQDPLLGKTTVEAVLGAACSFPQEEHNVC